MRDYLQYMSVKHQYSPRIVVRIRVRIEDRVRVLSTYNGRPMANISYGGTNLLTYSLISTTYNNTYVHTNSTWKYITNPV